MTWAWALADLTGAADGFVVPRSATITRRLNGSSSVTLTLDPVHADRAAFGRIVKGWRTPAVGGDRVLRASCAVSGIEASGNTDELESVKVTAVDAFGALGNRNMQQPFTATGVTPRDIVVSLVAVEDMRHPVGLYVAETGDSGPPRDREYERGKNVAEAVQQLAEVDDGFFYRVDPYEGTSDGYALFSELAILYPSAGTDRPGARFEYGPGTRGNLARAEANTLPPANYVTAYGAGEAGAQLIEVVSDAASIAEYGLFDVSLSLTDVSESATLAQHAQDALRPEPQTTYRVTAVEFGDSLPVPWDEFDVGDTVRIRLAGETGLLQSDSSAMVTGFTVVVDENGVERLTDITMEGV